VKHAGEVELDRLEPLLVQIRELDALRERRRGTFGSRIGVSIHFHTDGDGDSLYADLRSDGVTTRLPVDTASQRQEALGRLTSAVDSARPHPKD
jgi:hypothetical protein